MVGLLCLLILFVGLCMPSGKFSIVQALMIPQMICFSLLQFDIVPLTYLGFRNMFFSSGFNSLSMNTTTIVPKQIFPFFGLSDTSFLSNYNVTFVVICLMPLLIGLIGLFILRRCTSGSELTEKVIFDEVNDQENTKRESASLSQSYDKITILRFMFERILYEGTFYGLFVGSYLAWISMMYFFRYNQANAIDIVYAVVVIIVWVSQVFLLVRKEVERMDLSRWANFTRKQKRM